MASKVSAQEAINGGFVSGLQTDKLQPRLEIDEFALDKDVLNLFLMALVDLQSRNENDPWSWFQIAGANWSQVLLRS